MAQFNWRLFFASYWVRFAFLPMAKIIVATSVCTGCSNMPLAYCIIMGWNPVHTNSLLSSGRKVVDILIYVSKKRGKKL